MAENQENKKQVIHVKDLIIQADRVHFEQPSVQRAPLFGRPGRPVQENSEHETKAEESDLEETDRSQDQEEEGGNGRERKPFSWF